jgi:hypothetical protein
MKKEYLILLAVIIGLLAYLFLQDRDQTYFKLPQMEAIESASTDHIQIIKENRTVDLARKDAQWYINPQGYKADDIKVKNMLNAASDLEITALVSESGNYERYDLSDDKKITVKLLSQDKTQREFEIGRTAPTFQHTFIKLPGNINVYHAKGNLRNTFDLTTETLRDKIIFSFDKDAITAIDLQKADKQLALAKKEVPQEQKKTEEEQKTASDQPPKAKTVWQTADGGDVDQTAVERLLGSFSRLNCDGFVEGKAKADFKDPVWLLVFKTDQDAYTFAVYGKVNEDDNQIAATSSASDYVFQLLKTRVEGFEKTVDKLLGEPSKK